MFTKLKEYNDHEGEVWNWFIPSEGNNQAFYRLQGFLEKFGEIPGNEVDILVKHTPTGYFPTYNKLEGKLTIPEWDDFEDMADDLYKGGIRDLMSNG